MGIHERKEREREHRKEEIVDAAQSVFFQKGLLDATMDDIAEKAELSKGTLYLYYKSKEDLYLAVLMRGMRLLHDLLESAVQKPVSVPEALQLMFEAYLEFFNKHRNYFRMLHFYQLPQFHRQVSESMKQSCGMENQRIWKVVSDLLKRGMAEGLVRADQDPVEIGLTLWSSATALMMRIDAERELWLEHMNIDLEKALRAANALLLQAILTDRGRVALANRS